jgi:hypothetical protein
MAYNKRIVFPYNTVTISATGSFGANIATGSFSTGSSNNLTINFQSSSSDILLDSAEVFFRESGSKTTIYSSSIINLTGSTVTLNLPQEIYSLPSGSTFFVNTRSKNKQVGISNFQQMSVLGATTFEYITVAGGGGGGSWVGGGGGAGGVVTGSLAMAGTVNVIVGAGGIGSYNPGGYSGMPNSSPGDNSELRYVILGTSSSYAYGGGEGQSWDENVSIRGLGGSGGGKAKEGTYAGTAGQGNSGGTGTGTGPYPCGGGGGYSAAGSSYVNSTTPGPGGAGGFFNIVNTAGKGSPQGYVAGGGGGGCHGPGCNGRAAGGTGGGGQGNSETTTPADNGVTNTGGGGGGSGNGGSSVSRGGNGGSGLVVFKILTSEFTGTTTGSPTVTTSGAYTYVTFTSSGTIEC